MEYILNKFVENGQINIQKKDFKNIKENHGDIFIKLGEITSDIAVDKNLITFPYKKYGLSLDDIFKMFNRLKNYKHNFKEMRYKLWVKTDRYLIPWMYNDRQIVLLIGKNEYQDIDILTDYFSEECRIKAKRIDADASPFEKWQQKEFVTEMVQKCILKYNCITSNALREEIFLNTKEATQFKLSIAYSFYKVFNAEYILDISAGWGDRLISAIAHDAKGYLGCDPNKNLKESHDEIINMLGNGDNERFKVVYEPFEDVKFEENYKTDFIFSSPPYFNLEKYTDGNGQSIDKFPKFQDWLINFLFFSLKKAWSVLKIDGIMAIHMSDIKYNKIVEPMILYVITFLKNSEYIGVIPSHNPHSPKKPFRPIWLFQKTTMQCPDHKSFCNFFKKKYPDIYEKSKSLTL